MSNTKELNHPEWDKENSLTAPSDRSPKDTFKPQQAAPPLTTDEFKNAFETLNNTAFVDKFPRVERKYADPGIPLQLYGLVSFVPAKGATPNEKGIYGFAKLRGNYGTPGEANERAEFIIRNVDSYHQIYHTYVGRPFPCTIKSDYSAETAEIDIRKDTTASVSSSIKQKKLDEQKTANEIKEREEALLAESRQEEEDPYEAYITKRVKLAQIGFTYIETEKKLGEMKDIVLKTRNELEEMDKEHPDFLGKYLGKYMEARDNAGIKEDNPNNFIMYLGSDLKEELGW